MSDSIDQMYVSFEANYDQLSSAAPEISSVFADIAASAEESSSSISESLSSVTESFGVMQEAGGATSADFMEVLLSIKTAVQDVGYAVDGMSSAVTGTIQDLSVDFENLNVSATDSSEAVAEADVSASNASSGGFLSLFNQIGFGIMNFQNYLNIAKQVAAGLLGPAVSAETVTSALTTLDGSAAAAGKEMSNLNAFAAKTPFKTLDIDQAAEQLQGFGYNAQQVVPMIQSIGDALGSVGKETPAEMLSVVDVFGKMKTEGKVTVQTMNELAVHGINAWQALAEGAGKTIPQVQDLVKRGLLPASDAVADLTKGIEMNPLYAGGMSKAAGTFTGLLSTLQSNWDQVIAAFGTPIIKALEGSLNDLGSILASPAFQSFAGSVGSGIVGVFTDIGGAVQYVGNIFRSLNLTDFSQLWHSIGDEIGSITNKFKGAGNIFSTIGTDMDPIANVLGTIAHIGLDGLTGALGLISDALMGIDKAASGSGLSSMSGVFKQVSGIVGGALSADFQTFSDITQSLGKWWQTTMAPTIATTLPSFEKLGTIIATTVIPAFAKIWTVGQQIARELFPPLIAAFETIAPIVLQVGGFLADNLGKALQFLAPYAVQAAQAIGGFADGLITRVVPIVQELWSTITGGIAILLPMWNSVWPTISGVLMGAWDVMKGAVQVGWSLVSGIINVGLDILSGNWGKAWNDIKTALSGVWDGIKGIVQGAWNGIWSIIKGGINLVIGGIDNFIGFIDGIQIHIPAIGVGPVHTPAMDWNGLGIPKIPFLASGGNLAPGQIGVAGEAGPELIFGGSSGLHVMNNAQSMAAMAGSGKTEIHNHIYIDSREMSNQLMVQVLSQVRSSGHPLGEVA